MKSIIKINPVIILLGSLVFVTAIILYVSFFIYKPRSQQTALTFAFNSNGNFIYYLSPQSSGSQLRSLDTRPWFFLLYRDREIQNNGNQPFQIYWSQNQKALIFNQIGHGDNSWFSLFDFRTKNFTPLTLPLSSQVYGWSSDDTQIAYATNPDENGKSNINLFAVEKRAVVQAELLTEPLENITDLWWAADGQKLIIASQPNIFNFSRNISAYDFSTGKLTTIVSQNDGYTNFLAFGNHLIFLSSQGICEMDLETGSIRVVYDFSGSSYDLTCNGISDTQTICQLIDAAGAKRTFVRLDSENAQTKILFEIPVQQLDKVNLFFAFSAKNTLGYIDESGIIRLKKID